MRPQLTGLLLQPSLFSGTITTLLAVMVLGVSNWPYVLERLFFYNYLFGPEGLVAATEDGGGVFAAIPFIDSLNYGLFVAVAAGLVWLAIFVVLQLAGRIGRDTGATWTDLQAQGQIAWHELIKRTIIHGVILAAWGIYVWLFVRFILLFCITAARVGIRDLWAWQGLAYLVFGLLLLWVALHIHVIWMRLLCLRPRVFGGEDAILTKESKHF